MMSSASIITLETTSILPENCQLAAIANSICNVENLNETCLFDGFDCCNSLIDSQTISNIGDGQCHQNLNVLNCAFDMGDCVSQEVYENCASAYIFSVGEIGDGYCDDYFNNGFCGYDELDCCLFNEMSLNYCITCVCHDNSTLALGTLLLRQVVCHNNMSTW